MTDKNKTEIVAIIDRSISMGGLVEQTVSGFNTFLDEQSKDEGETFITRVQFDTGYQVDYEGVNVKEAERLCVNTYQCRGSTALLDAVGRTVNAVGTRLAAMEEEDRPGTIIFLIITDGEENSSREFRADAVKEMVSHQADKYSWSFVYLGGGDIESQKTQGASIGVAASNVYGYSASAQGTQALYANCSVAFSRRKCGVARGMVFNDSNDAMLTAQEAVSLIDDDSDSSVILSSK